MKPVIVRGVIIGEGVPKIAVPLTSRWKSELIEDVAAIVNEPSTHGVVDLIEWRADYFDDHIELFDTLSTIRQVIDAKPLIFTYRTAKEGGTGSKDSHYESLLKAAIDSGLIDLVDIELFMGDAMVSRLIDYAHAHDVKVIGSNHDFEGTPTRDEILERLQKMQALGADVLKIAIMPRNKKDILTLLEATVIMSEQYAKCPLITMAMSDLGAITRVTGEMFGSAITFGQVGKRSASGQIEASELSEMLMRIHHIVTNENKL